MVDLEVLRAEREELVAQASAILDEMEDMDPDSEDFQAKEELVQGLQEQKAKLEKRIENAEKLVAIRADLHQAAVEKTKGKAKTVRSGAKMKDVEPGTFAARAVKSIVHARRNGMNAFDAAKDIYGSQFAEHYFQAAQATTPDSAGGILVPGDYSTDLIELLRHRTVVRAAGARVLPVNRGSLVVPRQATGVSGSWVGEATGTNAQALTFDSITLTPKKCMAVVAMSNELIADSSPQADGIVREDLVAALGTAEDYAYIRGAATDASVPTGMRYLAETVTATAGTGTAAHMLSDVKGVLKRITASLKGNSMSLAWLMHPNMRFALEFAKNATNGDYEFPEVRQGMLRGRPIFETTAIPVNLGTGSDESEVYLVNVPDLLIGQTAGISVDVSSEASYLNSSGTATSAFALDQTVIRAIMRTDFNVRRNESVEVVSGVTWS